MLKIEKELSKATRTDVKRIGEYLIEQAKEDPLIAATLNKENKSLEDAYKYVMHEAKKIIEGGGGFIDDPVVYSWAQHYYDEDSIDMSNNGKKIKKIEKVKQVELPKEDDDVFEF